MGDQFEAPRAGFVDSLATFVNQGDLLNIYEEQKTMCERLLAEVDIAVFT